VRSKRVMSFNAINKKMRYYYRGGKGRRDLKWWEEGCIGEVAMRGRWWGLERNRRWIWVKVEGKKNLMK
jgi:hypothetical protein